MNKDEPGWKELVVLGRRWGQWVFALVLAIGGGSSAIVKALGLAGPTWLLFTVVVAGLVVAVPAKVVDARLQQLGDVAGAVRRGVFAVGVGGSGGSPRAGPCRCAGSWMAGRRAAR